MFSFTEGHCFLRVLIERAHHESTLPALTASQVEALDLVEAVADEPGMSVSFRQEPGDLFFINNWVLLHRRSEFTDDPDAALKRHILRIWLSMPNSRPIDPLFKDNWSAVDAGAIRGGMRSASAV